MQSATTLIQAGGFNVHNINTSWWFNVVLGRGKRNADQQVSKHSVSQLSAYGDAQSLSNTILNHQVTLMLWIYIICMKEKNTYCYL